VPNTYEVTSIFPVQVNPHFVLRFLYFIVFIIIIIIRDRASTA